MNNNTERPGAPSATTVVQASKRRSNQHRAQELQARIREVTEKGVATKKDFRSVELAAIALYSCSGGLTALYFLRLFEIEELPQ